jgi:hypothetical protein
MELVGTLRRSERANDLVAGTGVDPVTPRFSGACSAD